MSIWGDLCRSGIPADDTNATCRSEVNRCRFAMRKGVCIPGTLLSLALVCASPDSLGSISKPIWGLPGPTSSSPWPGRRAGPASVGQSWARQRQAGWVRAAPDRTGQGPGRVEKYWAGPGGATKRRPSVSAGQDWAGADAEKLQGEGHESQWCPYLYPKFKN